MMGLGQEEVFETKHVASGLAQEGCAKWRFLQSLKLRYPPRRTEGNLTLLQTSRDLKDLMKVVYIPLSDSPASSLSAS